MSCNNDKCNCKILKRSASKLAGYFTNLYNETYRFHNETMLNYEEAFKEVEVIKKLLK